MMAVLGSAMATFALVLPSLVLMILISKKMCIRDRSLGKVGSDVPTVKNPEYFVDCFNAVQELINRCLLYTSGYAMIPIIEAEVVDKHHWMTKEEFLDAIATTQVCPGALAINMRLSNKKLLRILPCQKFHLS